MRNIFLFCGICGYLFIPIKMVWPAWRLYDLVMLVLVFYTWRYALGAKNLRVIYGELGRASQLADDLEKTREESKRKTFFLNAISHDLKTPLHGLVLQSHLVEVGLKSGDAAVMSDAIAEIRRSADATAGLLDSLLECARLNWSEQPNIAARVRVADLCREVAAGQDAAASLKGVPLKCNAPPDLVISTDRQKLERVLTNLVANAVKFTPSGSVRVEARRAGSGVGFHVIDTGAGISTADQQKLFTEFFQADSRERDPPQGLRPRADDRAAPQPPARRRPGGRQRRRLRASSP